MNQFHSTMEAQPNCAICNGPSNPECPCESERLSMAVRQAEDRALKSRLHEIRQWVIAEAQSQVHSDFNTRVATRKATHASYLAGLPYYNLYLQYSGRPPLHPAQLAQLQAQIHEASVTLKRGIDGDWRAAVMRYPEILDHYYSLVDLRVAGSVAEPNPAIAHQGKIKQKSRRNSDLPSRSSGKRRDSRTLSIGGKLNAPPLAPLPPLMAHPTVPDIQAHGRTAPYYRY